MMPPFFELLESSYSLMYQMEGILFSQRPFLTQSERAVTGFKEAADR